MRLEEHSFKECVAQDEELRTLRDEHARMPADERRMAADWAYHSSIATRMFNDAVDDESVAGLFEQHWPEGVVALAIDPLYAPGILTVGSIEYQLGREEEAMELYLQLTALPPDEPDLPEIIDKAGEGLIDEGDYHRAAELYAAAENAFPGVAVYPAGLAYCLGKQGDRDGAVATQRRAVDLEPENHVHLTDLGWSLYEAGNLEEAEKTLRRAVDLAPDDYELARRNLEIVRGAMSDS